MPDGGFVFAVTVRIVTAKTRAVPEEYPPMDVEYSTSNPSFNDNYKQNQIVTIWHGICSFMSESIPYNKEIQTNEKNNRSHRSHARPFVPAYRSCHGS
jgi:hypothetical protein